MLTLHRASAGSGKTYALTKMFLKLYLSVKREEAPRRLRYERELNDSLSHILAITFTNKATAEMKQRIISALSALARFKPEDAIDKDIKEPDYYSDFLEEFHTTPEKLRNAARNGLEILLNNYSDFKVSTIDSFFQTVLRTFAYETNLQDNYGVEIDTEFINDLAIEGMMEAMDNREESDDIRYWFDLLMRESREKGKRWNAFQKTDTSFYADIKRALAKFDSEDYKDIREYLDRIDSRLIREAFLKTDEFYAARKEKLAAEIKGAAERVVAAVTALGFTADDLGTYLKTGCSKILAGEIPSLAGERYRSTFLSSALTKKAPIKKLSTAHSYLSLDFWNAVRAYHEEGGLWAIYRSLYPYMALMQLARSFVSDFLNDNNSIALAETNSLLRRVISDDDTPFIYERLGGRLNHLLIDEFQDTSRLQWENIRPLLSEPLGRGEESLLIGDAKQSIYRFRNADPSIIMQSVPTAFPDSEVKGDTVKENTNYRSDEHIVQFNNYIFSTLPKKLERGLDILYTNAIQATKRGKGRGYVRMEMLPDPTKNNNPEDADANSGEEPYVRLGEMVCKLMTRGYRQRDIAFLVRTRSQGQAVIRALMQYNETRGEGMQRIDFISEDSLTISSSRAVSTVVSCLKNITSAASLRNDEAEEEKDEGQKSSRVDWHKIRSELSFFVASHPEMEPDRQVEAFFAQSEHTDVLGDTVKKMQSTALPALVESLTATFVPPAMRKSDAPFLAAFQDSVLEYCNSHASDISSFLGWWDMKGCHRSINSPAETDAVQIMTVHKSKGIEFGVVIIPECDWDTFPNTGEGPKVEWKWVKPDIELPEGVSLPDYIPVKLTEALLDTPHANDFDSYLTLGMMDALNALYVAFTRAVNELYIFIPNQPETKTKTQKAYNPNGLPKKMGWILPDMFFGSDGKMTYNGDSASGTLPMAADLHRTEEGVIELGHPLSEQEIAEVYKEKDKKKKEEQDREVKAATGYYVNPNIDFLKYTETAPGISGSDRYLDGEDDDDTDPDPRSEGNLLHAAMEWINTEEDVAQAVNRLKVAGAIPFTEVERYIRLLSDALACVKNRGWFCGKENILNERPILRKGKRTHRPDRIMVNRETGAAVIVDYKFGSRELPADRNGNLKGISSHCRQVREYVKLLKSTGQYSSVTGYLWYVTKGVVVPVTEQ